MLKKRSFSTLCTSIFSSVLLSGYLSACAALNEAQRAGAEKVVISEGNTPLRGWDYVAEKLILKGISADRVRSVFTDPRMPAFSQITFKLKPIESNDIYAKFRNHQKVTVGQNFIRSHQEIFNEMESQSGVPKEIVTAILLVETHFGQNTGNELVLNRLARVSSVAEPETLWSNFMRLKQENAEITLEQVQARATYLEETFLPELAALFVLTEREKLDIFEIRGSIAGAFGIPQFLPKSYLAFGIDGNKNGKTSLFELPDAIFSTARFLNHYGWSTQLSDEKKRAVVWNYNHSRAYVDTIFWLAMSIKYQKKEGRYE